MTTHEAQKQITAGLQGIYPEGEIKAFIRIIFEEWMNYSTVDTIMRADSVLPDFVASKITDAIGRLAHHEPIQHIVGVAHFHGHKFKVTPHTLIPRPETEQLVDMIVADNDKEDLRILDVGTGTGCIAISLARALKWPQVAAFDISAEALQTAEANAKSLGVKVDFSQVDILTAKPAGRYDIVVSNPPYICNNEQAAMDHNVLDYEPHTALFVPDDDPLLFYRAIARFAKATLTPGGKIYFEINAQFGADTKRLLETEGFENVTITRDFYGRDRFASGSLRN